MCKSKRRSLVSAVTTTLLSAGIARSEPAPATQPADRMPQSSVTSANEIGTRPADAHGPSSSADLASLDLEALMNIEVTSVSRQKQKISDAPAAITVITQEDIARSGMTSIPELLRLSPGLEVARLDSSKWAITSRGLNDVFANKMLVMIDGRSVYTPLFGGVYWDSVDYVLPDLDRVEVIRGPGATMWGANAVNGVINISTRSARDTQGWLLDGLAGSEEQQGSVRYGGKIDDNTYFRVYSKYRNFEDSATAAARSANDGWDSVQGGFRLDHFTSSNDTLTLQGDLYSENLHEKVIVPIPVPPENSVLNARYTADGGNLLGRWAHRISDTSDLALQLYYDRVDRNDKIYTYQQDTYDLDFQHRFALNDRQEIIWGLGSRIVADRLMGAEGSSASPRDRGVVIANTFVQDDLAIVPERLHAIIGTKVEYNSYTNVELEPGARLLWTPNDKNTVWGSIARAVRTPTRVEEDGQLLFRGTEVQGTPAEVVFSANRDLKSEELLAYELGYRVNPVKPVNLDVAAFYNQYQHLVGQQLLPPVLVTTPSPHLLLQDQWENHLHGQTFGGELAATWKVTDRWKIIGSYTLLEVQLHHDRRDTATGERYFEGSSPQNQFQLRTYIDLTRNLGFNAAGYYVSSLAEQGIPRYFRVDLGMTWRMRDNVEVGFGVQNLFDDRHREFPDSGAYAVPSESERAFYGQLTIKL